MTRFILTILFLGTIIRLQAQTSPGEILINEVFHKIPLSKAFKTLESKYNVRIAYDYALIQNMIVALQLKDLNLAQSLEALLGETPLTFQHVGDNIVIVPRPPDPNLSKIEKINIRLSGSVLDAESEETLPQATISIRGLHIATTTNNDGYFTIYNVPSDTCTLEIRYLGYLTQTMRMKDIENPEQIRIKLRSDAEILNEVVVLDEYNQAVHLEEQPGALVFNPASLSSLPSLGEQDINRTMQLMPGVSATDESSAGMVIRGSHPSYNLTLLDGMTIYQQDHFFGSFSIINADIIKDVHVHKGMFEAKYGGRVSGVIDITSKNGNAVKPAFSVKLNSINAKATAEIPIGKKWSLFAAAQRSLTDVVQGDLYKSLFEIAQISNDQIQIFRFSDDPSSMSAPVYNFFDANTKLTFRPSPRDMISLSLYVSRDKMHVSDNISFGDGFDKFAVDSEEKTNWGNNGASLRWGRQWSDTYYSSIRISDSKFFRSYNYQQQIEVDIMSSFLLFDMENNIHDLTYAIDNEWLLHNKLSLEFGLSGIRQETFADFHLEDSFSGDSPPDETPEDSDTTQVAQSWLHSLYGTLHASLTSRLTASLGLRVAYYFNQEGQTYVEPRLTTRYKVTEQLNLKAGYARSNQFITQLFYYSPTGSISGINENFWMLSEPGHAHYPVISSDHVSTGATLKRKQIVYDAEVYYKRNLGVIIDDNLTSGNTDAYGVDIMIQKTSGIHTGWIAYSLARARQTHPDILNGDPTASWQDQRHELKVVDMLTLGNWNLASTLIYGSGKPYAMYEVSYHYNEDGMIDSYDLLLDYSKTSRLPAYFRMDLAATYHVPTKKSFKFEIQFSVHNVTNHQNIKTRKIDTTELQEAIFTNTELPATYNDVVLLGFLPTLSLHCSF